MEEIKRKRALFIYNPKSGYGAIKLYLDNSIIYGAYLLFKISLNNFASPNFSSK